ncbi:hypothetical protein ACS0TY_036645 [Phlomoides rotata]
MDMRAIEDIAVGEDLTPPLPPLAAVLHDSAVTSHCSACFSALPPQPFPPSTLTYPRNSYHVPTNTPTPLYCSPNCASIDSSLHFSSAEHRLLFNFNHSPPSTWTDSSDLRLSLRLVYIFQNLPTKFSVFPVNKEKPMENTERIGGLMTNRENLLFGESVNNQIQENRGDSSENVLNVLERIREGAKIMAKARRMCGNEDENAEKQEDFVLEEMVLCLVMTNAVEVQDKSGISIGVAVYDAAFSWINHSCSPNACYRFLQGMDHNEQAPFRIRGGDLQCLHSERNGYGPRVIVRSIKAVNKGEEVTIAYTDLLQPRETRQAELWLKYRFSCSCKRCAAAPTSYVDYVLQGLSVDNPDLDKIEKLMENFDDAVNDYLSFGDPKSCCKKLENLLNHGDLSGHFQEPKEVKSPQKVKLHPFHHLSINAYTTLASAFRVQASDLLALNYEIEEHKLEAFNMCKISCAYSLLLAGVVNHLYLFESSLVTTVANFWINAGESLLNLARSHLWDSFLNPRLIHSSFLNLKCDDCSLVEPIFHTPYQKLRLEQIKSRLYNCIANITPKVWRILASESHFLKLIQNPIDISLLASPPVIPDAESSRFEAEESWDQSRINLMLLSIHCLRYGTLLSGICYGLSAEMNYNRVLELRSHS